MGLYWFSVLSFRFLEYRVAPEENGSTPGPLPGSFKPTRMTWASLLLQHLQQRSCSLWCRYRPAFLFCKNQSGHVSFAVSFCVSRWRAGFWMVRVLQCFNLEFEQHKWLSGSWTSTSWSRVHCISASFQNGGWRDACDISIHVFASRSWRTASMWKTQHSNMGERREREILPMTTFKVFMWCFVVGLCQSQRPKGFHPGM